jgi:CRP-like cAMP-binding protein
VTKKDVDREIARMSAGEYFGEMALLNNEKRKANVVAVGDVECLVLQVKGLLLTEYFVLECPY